MIPKHNKKISNKTAIKHKKRRKKSTNLKQNLNSISKNSQVNLINKHKSHKKRKKSHQRKLSNKSTLKSCNQAFQKVMSFKFCNSFQICLKVQHNLARYHQRKS